MEVNINDIEIDDKPEQLNQNGPYESLISIEVKYSVHPKMRDGNVHPSVHARDNNFRIVDNIK